MAVDYTGADFNSWVDIEITRNASNEAICLFDLPVQPEIVTIAFSSKQTLFMQTPTSYDNPVCQIFLDSKCKPLGLMSFEANVTSDSQVPILVVHSNIPPAFYLAKGYLKVATIHQTSFALSSRRRDHTISFVEEGRSANFSGIHHTDKNATVTLKVFCNANGTKTGKEYNLTTRRGEILSYCNLWYFFNILKTHETVIKELTQKRRESLMSWTEAETVCGTIEAHLPVIRDKNEQDILLQFAKDRQEWFLCEIEIIFLGIKIVKQVRPFSFPTAIVFQHFAFSLSPKPNHSLLAGAFSKLLPCKSTTAARLPTNSLHYFHLSLCFAVTQSVRSCFRSGQKPYLSTLLFTVSNIR